MDFRKISNLLNHSLWPIFLIVIITSIIYIQAVQFDFVNYDDDGYVYQNPLVKSGISINGTIEAFAKVHKANWIPLTLISYMTDTEIFGVSPAGYHFTNIIFHVLNALLVFFFLRISTGRAWSGFFVAMLFAIHPLHVESVSWISERKDVLSTFFGLCSIIMYVRYAKKKEWEKYVAVFLLFLCSLMSKPMLVTLPMVFLLLDFWPLWRMSSNQISENFRNLLMLILEKLPFFILSLVFSLIAILSQKSGGAVGTTSRFPFPVRLMNAVVSYAEYLYKAFRPTNLSVIYPYQHNIGMLHLLISIFVLLTITCGVFFWNKKNPALLVGWSWFLITLLPVIGLIQVGTQSMADRYTYFPLIGLSIAAVWAMHDFTIKFQLNKRIVGIVMAAIILTFSMMTVNQVSTWKNSETLFAHALSVTRDNWVAHLNYGEALIEKGEVDAAIDQYEKALAIKPDFELAYLNIGAAFAQKGQTDTAIAYYQKALAIKQNLPTAWLNLGNAYFRKGMPDKAMTHYETALSFKPNFAEVYCGIGAVMAGKGDLHKAMQAFQQALDIDPGSILARTSIRRIEQKMTTTQ